MIIIHARGVGETTCSGLGAWPGPYSGYPLREESSAAFTSKSNHSFAIPNPNHLLEIKEDFRPGHLKQIRSAAHALCRSSRLEGSEAFRKLGQYVRQTFQAKKLLHDVVEAGHYFPHFTRFVVYQNRL